MNSNILIFLTVVLFTQSCVSQTDKAECDSVVCTDTVGIAMGIKYGEDNGSKFVERCETFQDGEIMAIVHRNDSLKHGPYKYFYANGKIKEQGTFYNDNKVFDCVEYHPNGQMKKESNYLWALNKIVLNDYVSYDTEGNIIADSSNFCNIIQNKDTLSTGDTLIINFEYILPYFGDSCFLDIGPYDFYFSNANEIWEKKSFKTLPFDGENKAEFKKIVTDLGKHEIRIILVDTKKDYNFNNPKQAKARMLFYYFFYFVKE